MSATATASAPKTTRAARKDVETAFAPLATKLKLNFVPGESVDYTQQNLTVISGLGGGLFSAMTIGQNGAMSPVFPKLPPRKAAELADIYNALSSVI